MKRQKSQAFEISFLESLVRERPLYVDALRCLAEAYSRSGNFKQGLAIDLRLARLCETDAIVQYNLACSYALMRDKENAIRVLRLAVDLGYDDYEHLVGDEDLKWLHGDRRFESIRKKIGGAKGEPKPPKF